VSALHVVVLAAGKGTRMKSSQPKVLHELAGVRTHRTRLRTVDGAPRVRTIVVVGHGADRVRSALAARTIARVRRPVPQLGTGHALLAS
jgi:bifunctional UDP-N-acetylglucosamine pyrophosphorylase/glucosamine-1-phosphate N-acetyltransferase